MPYGTTKLLLRLILECLLIGLPVELEHGAMQVIKQLNFNLDMAGEHRNLQLNELEEIRNDVYDNTKIYNKKTKAFHDKTILQKLFTLGQKVLLYNSKLHMFSGKQRSRWMRPFVVQVVSPRGAVEIETLRTMRFLK